MRGLRPLFPTSSGVSILWDHNQAKSLLNVAESAEPSCGFNTSFDLVVNKQERLTGLGQGAPGLPKRREGTHPDPGPLHCKFGKIKRL